MGKRNFAKEFKLQVVQELQSGKAPAQDLSGLIHHSDQGVQYAANQYITELEKKGIQPSMSRKANPYDNAHMESAIKTIKYEEVYMDDSNNLVCVIESKK